MVVAAEHAGVRRIVHLSVLGVSDDPKLGYLHSKWRGEQLVRESALEWVVLRPSLLFGRGDGFFNIVKTTLKWWSPGIVAIPGKGDARFQPLAAADLAIAVEKSLVEPERAGQVYEIGGPEPPQLPRDRGRGDVGHRDAATQGSGCRSRSSAR